MTRTLHPVPLTAEAFVPFGDIVSTEGAPQSINYGATQKFADLAHIDLRDSGRAAVHLYRSTTPVFPFSLRVMENHPLGSQLFMPLSGRPYLVVVAPPGPFDPEAIRAFVAGPGQGVNLAPGVWHHFNLALVGVSDFLVVDREGLGENCEEVALDGSILLAAPELP
ncbi:MAG: ureidoglycolate lyase [Rhizomicrobium sp.]